MPYLHTASLRPSLLALAIVSNLPIVAYAAVEDMTVTATGNARSAFEAPMMVSVIDATAPENQTASSAADLLRTVPGLTLDGTGRTNGQDVNLRGYDRRGVLVLVDGVRQGTDTGHLNSTFLDPALIKRIEVVRGPSALLYGSGALGGVIAYDTADAKDLLEAGQNSGYRVFGTAATGDHSLGMGASAFGRTDTLDGLLAWSSRDRGDLRQSDGATAPNDEAINNMEVRLEKKSFEMIALQQPVTTDLRMIITVMKASSDLERMGDHAVSIAKSTIRVKGETRIAEIEKEISDMSDYVKKMVDNVLVAYVKTDQEDARMIAQMDERVNDYYRDIYYKTIDSMKANPETVVSGTDYLSVAQYLERIGDYVTNICEWIVYLATGKISELNSNRSELM